MALISNHSHHSYQPSAPEMLTSTYQGHVKTYEPFYPSPYNSPNYESARIAYQEGYSIGGNGTPRRSDQLEYARTPDSYDRTQRRETTPQTPQRFINFNIFFIVSILLVYM